MRKQNILVNFRRKTRMGWRKRVRTNTRLTSWAVTITLLGKIAILTILLRLTSALAQLSVLFPLFRFTMK